MKKNKSLMSALAGLTLLCSCSTQSPSRNVSSYPVDENLESMNHEAFYKEYSSTKSFNENLYAYEILMGEFIKAANQEYKEVIKGKKKKTVKIPFDEKKSALVALIQKARTEIEKQCPISKYIPIPLPCTGIKNAAQRKVEKTAQWVDAGQFTEASQYINHELNLFRNNKYLNALRYF